MRPSRLVLVALVPLAFAVVVTGDEAVRDATPVRRPGPARADTAPGVPRPEIVPRSRWQANEKLVRERSPSLHGVRTVFIHHTNHPNDYACSAVPRMLRRLEADHVRRGWDDLGYNFIVDRCGTIYEGRSGGLTRSVEGAHTKGFNAHSLGIAALGTFDSGHEVPQAVVDSIAALAAWKLRSGIDPRGRTRMTSSSDASRYGKGDKARLYVIAGHRDTYTTDCPGAALYDRLGEIRGKAARVREQTETRESETRESESEPREPGTREPEPRPKGTDAGRTDRR